MHKKFVKATEHSNNLELKMSSLTADVRHYKSKSEASEKKLVKAQAELKQVKDLLLLLLAVVAPAPIPPTRKPTGTILCKKSDIHVQEHTRKLAINLENKELERKRVVKDKNEHLSLLKKRLFAWS